MEYMGVDVFMAAVGLVAVFAVFAVLEFVTERSLQRSVDNALTRMRGAILGVATIILLVAVNMVELVFAAPELVITALGIGAIIAGISWEVFGAVAVLTYIVGAAVGRGY